MAATEVLDGRSKDQYGRVDWLQKSFHLRNNQSNHGPDIDILFARIYTTAMIKFTDTSPGGNVSINPFPQPSVWTDPPPLRPGQNPGELNKSPNQGSFYSEMFDDNQQVIYMRFGVPVFNSLTGFYSRFYNSSYARLVRTGMVSNSLSAKLGSGIASAVFSPLRIVAFAAEAVGGILTIPNKILNWAERKGSSLYYFKATMPLYWGAAQSILNHIAVNKGFIAPIGSSKNLQNEGMDAYGTSPAELQAMHGLYPDIISPKGTINLKAVATRAQQNYNKVRNEMLAMGSSRQFNDIRRTLMNWYKTGMMEMASAQSGSHHKYDLSLSESKWFTTPGLGRADTENEDGLMDESATIKKSMSGFWSHFLSSMNEGDHFVGFRVNPTGSAQESFSNSFRESELGQMINQVSGSARSSRFSLNNGQLMDNPLYQVAKGFVDKGVEILGEVGDALGLSGVPGVLMGNAYADIPKFWDSATTNFSSKSYTIDLISPYGDIYSQLINIYMPLSMLLAGALARSTGRHSYTEPFLCQLFDKGRAQTRLGMIKSLTIQRGGNGNVSWTQDHEPLNIRVTLEIEDMESVMHMPLVENIGTGATAIVSHAFSEFLTADVAALWDAGWFDLDTPFTDYMAVLSSCDLTSQIYNGADIIRKYRVNQLRRDIQASDAYLSSALANNPISNVAKLFMSGTFHR